MAGGGRGDGESSLVAVLRDGVGDVAGGHVAAEYLDPVQVDNRPVVAQGDLSRSFLGTFSSDQHFGAPHVLGRMSVRRM